MTETKNDVTFLLIYHEKYKMTDAIVETRVRPFIFPKSSSHKINEETL